MRKTLIYTVDALDPQLIFYTLKKDIKDQTIKEIIIPDFILKAANSKYSNFSKIIKELQYSPKIQIKTFPVLYDKSKYNYFDCLMLFLTEYVKCYRNLYIRSRNNQIIIACLKRGFKVFIDNHYTAVFKNINDENSLFPSTNNVFFDTCYYCEMFKSNIGLNILTDKNYKKIILSSILEELLKINKVEIFNTLVYIINKKRDYNIEFIITEKPYTEPYLCNDLMLLSYINQLNSTKYKDDVTVYTGDIELTMQCIALKIKTSSNGIFDKEPTLNKSLSNNISENTISKSQITIPILKRNNNIYISSEHITSVYKDIASRLYSKVLNKKSINYFMIKQGYHAKVKNENTIFRVFKIDIPLGIAYLEKTTIEF